MITKANVTCEICKHNRTLLILKAQLNAVQVATKNTWEKASVAHLEDHVLLSEGSGLYTLNDEGEATVIPSFESYSKSLEKVYFINPFEVDWMLFDIHDAKDIDYISSLVDMLHDQKALWENDYSTKGTRLMKSFEIFTSTVLRLFTFMND